MLYPSVHNPVRTESWGAKLIANAVQTARRLLGLLEVTVQFGFDEDDAIKELLDDLLLVTLVCGPDLCLLRLGILVDCRLDCLSVARMLCVEC